MKTFVPIAALACLAGLVGWAWRSHVDGQKCSYLTDGYQPFVGEYNRLPAFPDGQIPKEILVNVQQCWAEQPYFGRDHPIHMVEAKKLSETRYYLAFNPAGITDINLIFLVDRHDGVIEARQRSTM